MVDEINSLGGGWFDRLQRGEKAKSGRAEKSGEASPDEGAAGREAHGVRLSGEMAELLERIRNAETHRKERVHEVLEKLQRGDLVTSETVREAAERIMRGGA